MADEKTQWRLELEDALSKPTDDARDALGRFVKQAEDTDRALKLLSFEGLVTGLESGIGLIERFGHALHGLAEPVAEFAKFGLEMLSFKEDTLASLTMMLGTKKAAEDLFRQGMDFAANVPLETEQVLESFKRLGGAGFSVQQIPVAFQAIADVASLSPKEERNSIMSQLTAELAHVQGFGALRTRNLQQIVGSTSGAGIGFEDIYKTLEKNTGKTREEVEGLLSTGGISSSVGLYSVIEAIKNKTGELGAAADSQAHTMSGLWSTLKSRASEYFFEMDLDHSAGFKTTKGVLENLTAVLNYAGGSGQRFVGIIGKMFDGLLTGFLGLGTGEDGLQRMTSFMDSLADKLEGVDWAGLFGGIRTKIEDVWNWLASVDWGSVWDGMKTAWSVASTIVTGLGLAFEAFWKLFKVVGNGIGDIAVTLAAPFITFVDVLEKVWGNLGRIYSLLGKGDIRGAIHDSFTAGAFDGVGDIVASNAAGVGEAWKHGFADVMGNTAGPGSAAGIMASGAAPAVAVQRHESILPAVMDARSGASPAGAAAARPVHQIHVHVNGSDPEGKTEAAAKRGIKSGLSEMGSMGELMGMEAAAS